MKTRSLVKVIGSAAFLGVVFLGLASASAAEPAPAEPAPAAPEPGPPELGPPELDGAKVIRPGGNEEAWAKKRVDRVGVAGIEATGFAGRGFGLRPFVGDGTAGSGGGTAGFMARERGTGLLLTRWLSARYADEFWLGYDGVDLTARALLDAAVGLHVPVTDFTGPVLRLGLLAEMTQLTGFSKAELRVATGEFGWTYARGPTHLDLVLQVAPTLVGYAQLGPLHRTLEGLTWSTYLTAGWEDLLLDFRMSQIGQTSAGGPVTDLRAELCGLLGRKKPNPNRSTRGKAAAALSGPHGRDFRGAVCADVSYGSAAADPSDSGASGAVSPSRWTTIGLSLLYGRSSRLDPVERPAYKAR